MSALDEQLARLATLSSGELRAMWQRVTGSAVPKVSPNLLRLALGYELQAKTLGGLSRKSQQRLSQLAAAKTRTTAARPGMRLVREWTARSTSSSLVRIGEFAGTIVSGAASARLPGRSPGSAGRGLHSSD